MVVRNFLIVGGIVVCVSLPGLVFGDSFTITDIGPSNIYHGGTPVNPDPNGSNDVVGKEADYGVDALTVTRDFTNNRLQIDITGPFFDPNNGAAPFIFAGDVFLSSDGWTPNSTGTNYSSDSFYNGGEEWEYVLSMDGLYDGEKLIGEVNLYKVDQNNGEIEFPEVVLASTGGNYRVGQEYRWISDNSAQFSLGTGSWSLDGNTETMSFYLDSINGGMTLADYGLDGELGVHWTETCGNDVVEGVGGDPVPEPATMLLFGTGLAGLAGLRSRKKKA